MQTQLFTKTKIALAVGTALLAMAGVAQAAPAPAAISALRATKPLLITPASQANADSLYTTAGANVAVPVTVQFTAPTDGTGVANFAILQPGLDGLHVNGVIQTLAPAAAGYVASGILAANDDLHVYAVDASAVKTDLTVTAGTVVYTLNPGGAVAAPANGVATATFTLSAPGGTARFRVDPTSGKVQFSTNGAAAVAATATQWQDVNLEVKVATGTANFAGATAGSVISNGATGIIAAGAIIPNALHAWDSAHLTGAVVTGTAVLGTLVASDITTITAIAGQAAFNTLAPTIKINTTSNPASATNPALVSGLVFDTITPVTLITTATNITVKTNAAACGGAVFNAATALTVTDAPATVGTAVAPTATADGSFKNTIALTAPTGTTLTTGVATGTATVSPDWTSGAVAVDGAAYSSTCFNTGISGNNVPVTVAPVLGAEPTYTFVFDAAGAALKATAASGVWPAQAAYTDGAAPVIVSSGITFSTPSTATVPLTNVGVTFSEDMSLIGSAGDLREVLENIFVGTNTLAALSLNSFGITAPTLGAFALSAGQDTLTVNNISATDVATLSAGIWTGKSMSVSRGISFQEVNDHNYAANIISGAFYDSDTPGAPFGPNGEELSGGVQSASGVVEAIPSTAVAQTAVAPAATIAWGTDTSALASASSSSSPDLIDTITVTFAAGKSVKYAPVGTTFGTATALAAAKNATDLANNLVVDVFGSNNIKFQVKPLSATLDTANQITVKIPTAFIYNKLTNAGAQLKSVWVGYVADGNNQANNTLVATDAASTLTSPIRVAQGIIGSQTNGAAGAWVTADLTAAGAEPVVLPLVFTAVQTGNQSTLLTQNIQSNIVGSTAGSIVKAYLAYWIDLPKQSIALTGADLKSGKISNPGDKVATDLAIEFSDGTGNAVAALILTELQAVKPKQDKKPGVQDAEGPTPAKDIPVYVKLVRSNDAVNTGNAGTGNASNNSQGYLNARAIMASTYAAAKAFGTNDHDNSSPIYEVLLNPVTGEIKGRLTGNIVIKPSSSTGNRGLRFLDANGKDTGTATVHGSSIVAQKSATGLALPGTANVNLLMGIDPLTTDLGAITALNPFVLLTHQDSTGKYTLLTSADPTAGNYLPFAPDVMNKATGTGGIAVRATAPLSVTDVWAFDIPVSANWALYGFGNPSTRTAATGPGASAASGAVSPDKAFPRMFVGLETVNGLPESFWTADGVGALPIAKQGDIALSIAGNNVGVATELTSDTGNLTGPTLSNIGAANQVNGSVAVGWSDERGATDGATAKLGKIYVAQASGPFAPAVTPAAPKVKKGWSLVTVPGTRGSAGTFNASTIDAVIKVGAQVGLTGTTLTAQGTGSGLGVGQFSWFAVDGAMPTMTAGDAVFVHAKSDGNL